MASVSAVSDPNKGYGPFHARLRIEPHPDADCELVERHPRGNNVRQNEVQIDDCSTETGCRATFSNPHTSGHHYVSSSIGCYCICPVFGHHDCVWEFREFDNGKLVVSVIVPDRSVLRDIVENLRGNRATVYLESIVPSNVANAAEDHRLFDVSTITEKQAEAIQIAVASGYYDHPRRADLDQLAETLDISRSAVSQRLNAAETKLVREFSTVNER